MNPGDITMWLNWCHNLGQMGNHVPIACIYMCKSQILYWGFNTHIHCEIIGLKYLLNKYHPGFLSQVTLIINMEPCIGCSFFLLKYRIKTIVFGPWNQWWGGLGGNINLRSYNSSTLILGGYGASSLLLPIQRFFIKNR